MAVGSAVFGVAITLWPLVVLDCCELGNLHSQAVLEQINRNRESDILPYMGITIQVCTYVRR